MTTVEPATKRRPVGIGDLVVSGDPEEVLVAYGLGSCIGISAYDAQAKVGGLAHVLLPGARSAASSAAAKEPARFADSGVDKLVADMVAAGASKGRIRIKLAGGAAVLGRENGERFKIGERNAEAIRERLRTHGLTAVAEEVGGTKGRTLEVQIATGRTLVRLAASAAREL